MKTTRAASLCFLILMIGLDGCGSPGSRSTGPYTPTPAPAPSPSIAISPVSAIAGSPDLTLTVTAVGAFTFFGESHKKSEVVWSVNGSSDTWLTTTFVSGTELTAVIPADLLANPVTAHVAVGTGDPAGSEPFFKSVPVTFSVTTASSRSSPLLISSISPTSAAIGSSDVTLTISGSGFAPSCRCTTDVVWSIGENQTSLTTTSGSDTERIVVIPAALLTTPVTAEISIQRWHFADSFPIAVPNSIAFNVTAP